MDAEAFRLEAEAFRVEAEALEAEAEAFYFHRKRKRLKFPTILEIPRHC